MYQVDVQLWDGPSNFEQPFTFRVVQFNSRVESKVDGPGLTEYGEIKAHFYLIWAVHFGFDSNLASYERTAYVKSVFSQ